MHARAIILAAAMVLPIIAAPVPAPISSISPIPTVERRSDFSVANLFRDLLKRESVVEITHNFGEPNEGVIETSVVEARQRMGRSVGRGDRRDAAAQPEPIKFNTPGGHRRDAEAGGIKFNTSGGHRRDAEPIKFNTPGGHRRDAEAGGIKFNTSGGHRRDAEPIKFNTPGGH
ncbi:uncharacterized protein ALTATR162_LOCUS804 [Alternaria atra]|uniref:Uncharacterized protein n=1 Tax=Alternaria atra TaxID=119953 RepID=A0A8J2HSG9_9PLEO|nr:uncharacterized protein ALTATR162_LOCUS804 [Alternaria atra]CAG5140866.1 unnamed protein product [Alternaria atra]